MSEKFTVGENCDLSWFLGIGFKTTSEGIQLSSARHVKSLLKKFGMENCKPASTPLADKLELSKTQMPEEGTEEFKEMRSHDYRGLVGSISYLALTTRPDLAFSAHLLARFLSNPGFPHWQAAKRYLSRCYDT